MKIPTQKEEHSSKCTECPSNEKREYEKQQKTIRLHHNYLLSSSPPSPWETGGLV